MKVFKTRLFAKWARKEKIPDSLLIAAIEEMEQGLIDANLGGNVYKKRIALEGKGKRSGIRTIITYKYENMAFFIFGYAKNEIGNISLEDKKIAIALAKELFSYSDREIKLLLTKKKLIEVT